MVQPHLRDIVCLGASTGGAAHAEDSQSLPELVAVLSADADHHARSRLVEPQDEAEPARTNR